MKFEKLLLFLLLSLALLAVSGCRGIPEGESAPAENETSTAPYVDPGEENPMPREPREPLEEEVKSIVHHANKAALAMCVRGFEEELATVLKRPFSHYKAELSLWYSRDVLANLESFYENHLGEWGYEMGFAFPLHTRERVEEGFVSLVQEGKNRVLATFDVPSGHEERALSLYILEKEDNGLWRIAHVD